MASAKRAHSSAVVRLAVHFGFVVLLLTSIAAQAQTYTVLHVFTGHDGSEPETALTLDRAGNLYGTTRFGGAGYGTVFKLSRAGSGWILSTIYTFQDGADGAYPGSRLVFGPDGTLYGTAGGGSGSAGVVYNLRPQPNACTTALCPWQETVIYTFSGGADGGYPGTGALTFDSAGNLYGTGGGGGLSCEHGGCGVVYKLTRSGGSWTESVLYDFTGGSDGQTPNAGVTFNIAGNLYGTTLYGGANSQGTVYELTPSQSGWTETTLHAFGAGRDGYTAFGGVIFDIHGNMYGTTYNSGAGNPAGGTVYKLQPSGGGWNYSIVDNLAGFAGPSDDLALDNVGNLYGTVGIDSNGLGNVFELTPSGESWVYAVVHEFPDEDNGAEPIGGVVLDASRNIYGTASVGGGGNGSGQGVVFEIAP
jgi:uncharacterized repeat protein (TIGR03803 family)